MSNRIRRRTMLGLSPLAMAACAKGGEYFGKTEAPDQQRLIYQIGAEPGTLDPALSAAGAEDFILPSMFEGLVTLHPTSAEPLAGIATHYESNSNHTRYTFYLRGHPNPSGTKLPSTASGLRPAHWSDGRPITAHDFVYSWRRVLDPKTGSPMNSFLYCIRNAEEIVTRKRPVEDLAVRALDDLSLEVDMRSSTPHFLQLQDMMSFYAVPRHVIERVGPAWTKPEHMVTSGAFTLREWRPYEVIRLARNPHHYESEMVVLNDVTLLPVSDATANVNLYKAGESDSMSGKLVAPVFLPLLRNKRDFHVRPAFSSMFYVINTKLPPFDNVLVRYALNMATDKKAIARYLASGQAAALSLMPPFQGYPPVQSLPVPIDGATYDVLSYNPEAARALMRKAGVERLPLEILYPNRPATKDLPQILQQQWRETLGAEVALATQEEQVWIENRNALRYKGVSERGWEGDYLDPNTFLEAFRSGPSIIGSGWSDPQFDTLFEDANATPGRLERLAKLAACERLMLCAMPIIPLFYNVKVYMQKPYVRNFDAGPISIMRFKYARIDTDWRQAR